MTKKPLKKRPVAVSGSHSLYNSDQEFESLERDQTFTSDYKKEKQIEKTQIVKNIREINVSVCITVFNEERTIAKLIDSLLNQSARPTEIIIIDGGSKDQTVNIIKHFQNDFKKITLVSKKLTRSQGRNLSVTMAKSHIIAMTDAGCTAQPDWLEKITEPFSDQNVEIVAGFYDMTGTSPMQKAFSVFLGVTPANFGANFLPSTRSVAFRKELWEKVNGFPENMNDTAEDTLFNFKVIRAGINFTRVKKARVDWIMPDNLGDGLNKIYKYALGDAKSRVWNHPSKGLISHNVLIIYKFARYFFGLMLLILGFSYPGIFNLLLILLILYIYNAFRKVYAVYEDVVTGLWGIALQFMTDFAAMTGFLNGLYLKPTDQRLKKSFQ